MDIQYDKVDVDKDSFGNTEGPIENSIQSENPENQFDDSIKATERRRKNKVLKNLFIIFALVLISIWLILAYTEIISPLMRKPVPKPKIKLFSYNMFEIESFNSTKNRATVDLKIKDEISKLNFSK